MPRLQPQRPQRFFRGSEFGRLMTMIAMCVVLVMMIKTASNPGVWQWLVSKPGQPNQAVQEDADRGKAEKVVPETHEAAKPQVPAVVSTDAKKIPTATGPTDEDADEAEAAIEEYDYVSDGTLFIPQENNPAYERLVRWVINQPYGRLLARVTQTNPTYNQFRAAPRDFREPGKIFEINLHLRQVVKFDVKLTFDNPDEQHEPVTLYEMWGTTDESRGRFFHLIVYDPPTGLPVGQDVREDVRFVGYFFRLQAYEPGNAKLNAPLQLAPSFIGRIAWRAAAPGGVVSSSELPWMILLGGGIAITIAVCLGFVLLGRRKRNVAYVATDLPPPPAMSVEEWLDRVDGGSETSAEANGHADDLDAGEAYRNGHSNGSSRLFSDRQDGT
jgi:hypothetical protein